jgi:hypothetical protein
LTVVTAHEPPDAVIAHDAVPAVTDAAIVAPAGTVNPTFMSAVAFESLTGIQASKAYTLLAVAANKSVVSFCSVVLLCVATWSAAFMTVLKPVVQSAHMLFWAQRNLLLALL